MHVSVILVCIAFVWQTCLVHQNVRYSVSGILDSVAVALHRVVPYVTGIGLAQFLSGWLPQDVTGVASPLLQSIFFRGATLQDESPDLEWESDPVSPSHKPDSPSPLVGLPALLFFLFRTFRRNYP